MKVFDILAFALAFWWLGASSSFHNNNSPGLVCFGFTTPIIPSVNSPSKPTKSVLPISSSLSSQKSLVWKHVENAYWEQSTRGSRLGWTQPRPLPKVLLLNITDDDDMASYTTTPDVYVELDTTYKLVRLSGPNGPLLWYRVEDGWYGCWYVRPTTTTTPTQSLQALPPITSRDIERFLLAQENANLAASASQTKIHDNHQWTFAKEYWAKFIGNALLEDTSVSPLTQGVWELAPYYNGGSNQQLSKATVHATINKRFDCGYASFDRSTIWPLRQWSHTTSGRVKWFRKQIRQHRALPPILLWWFSGLEDYVILDGHDRLLAAHLEDIGIDDAMCLRVVNIAQTTTKQDVEHVERVETRAEDLLTNLFVNQSKHHRFHFKNTEQIRVEAANRKLVAANVPQRYDRRTCRAMGTLMVSEWIDQVTEQMKALGLHDISDLVIYRGLPIDHIGNKNDSRNIS